ncbi:hypothetical protein CLIT_20p00260 (plasmid) [Peptoclostridium litorale DSM 5388]|uniref:Uncharacterized protein n=1 Tax=Peptoclostridium litorale DSM 5388 TaxID=1121324 RepID=A0A069RJ28_PEPLI|nr:hypothetical protein CLIT_20p00260 [Peptoclostridium litorale DSM 5388]
MHIKAVSLSSNVVTGYINSYGKKSPDMMND